MAGGAFIEVDKNILKKTQYTVGEAAARNYFLIEFVVRYFFFNRSAGAVGRQRRIFDRSAVAVGRQRRTGSSDGDARPQEA